MTNSAGRLPGIAERADAHALELLEFPRVLERIAALTASEPGRRSVLSLSPWRDPSAVDDALSTADEMISLLLRFEGWTVPAVPDAESTVRRLAIEGAVLGIEELNAILQLLRSSRSARADLRRLPDDLPRMAALGGRMARLQDAEDRLSRSLDPAGGIADSASPALGRLRRALRESRTVLVRRLDRFVRQLPERLQVPHASVTIRAGRYCVPVRREGGAQVGGIVHDESATHQTLFIEPPLAIEPMNRIAELEREESREIQRVLRELTDYLRPQAEALSGSLHALAEADSLSARARFALQLGGVRPAVADAHTDGTRTEFRVVDARHPLLEGWGEPVVPFSLDLHADEKVLLISGPNAGGKTVLLKAVGLLAAMAQAGIVPPVGEGSRFPLFRRFFAIIGDEQSIQASLSTFSAQAQSLKVILDEAGTDSLVLIDELGGSTDPAEGSALAAAVLLRLVEQAGLTLATTHLGDLKELAGEIPSIVNASLQFDTQALRPTFRLIRDRPGRSYALEIAQRLGLPRDVLEVAASRLSGSERRLDSLLQQLERREAELDRLVAVEHAAASRSREIEKRFAERLERLARREKEAEREARRTVEKYLLEARREVDREVERLRARAATARPADGALEESVREARSAVETLLRDSRASAPEADVSGPNPELAAGMRVRSRSLGVEGRLLDVGAGQAVLDSGGIKITVGVGDIEEISGPVKAPELRKADSQLPDIAPRTEVDLRGLRVDEIGSVLALAIDAAVVNDVPALRIVHGKGTGALRDEVERLLSEDPRVSSHRAGGFQEGGSGVTVVEFGLTRD